MAEWTETFPVSCPLCGRTHFYNVKVKRSEVTAAMMLYVLPASALSAYPWIGWLLAAVLVLILGALIFIFLRSRTSRQNVQSFQVTRIFTCPVKRSDFQGVLELPQRLKSSDIYSLEVIGAVREPPDE